MEKHIVDMMNLVDQLITLREISAENMQLALLLCSLPENYENLVIALNGRSNGDINVKVENRNRVPRIPSPQTDVALKVNKNFLKREF